MIAINLSQLVSVTQGQLQGQDQTIQHICTDSRKIQKNDTYLALQGEHFDGHDFCKQAVELGVKSLIVSQFQPDLAETVSQLVVPDTLIALGQIAAHNKKRAKVRSIAITGSSGKTTVKEMLAAICRLAGKTLATQGNFNNQIGAPLTLLELDESYEYAVIELGASKAGDIAYTAHLVQPDVAMVNNIGTAHLEGFGSLQGTAMAKGEIYQHLAPKGTAIVNMDCEYVDTWQRDLFNHQRINYSSEPFADIYYSELHLNAQLCPEFNWHYRGQSYPVKLQIAGEHNAMNALAAISCATALGITPDLICHGLNQAGNTQGRLSFIQVNKQLQLIDDTYNANSASMKAAIQVLAQATGIRIFVMGDMGELGDECESIHQEVGEFARSHHINFIYTKGEMSQFAQTDSRYHFSNFDALITALTAHIKQFMQTSNSSEKITVLVKGSRFAKMETVIQALNAIKEVNL